MARFRCRKHIVHTTHRLAFRPGPGSLSSHCQAPRRPSGRNYTVHTRKVQSRLLAATKLFDRVRDPRIPLVKGAPGVHRRFGARSRRRGSLSQSAMSLSGQIRSPARIVMWLCQESGMNFTYRVVTGLLKRCHTWVSLSVLPVNVKDPASFVTETHAPDRYTSTL